MRLKLADAGTTGGRRYGYQETTGRGNLVVAAAAVGDDLDAGEREGDMGRGRREELLTGFGRQHHVVEGQSRVPERAAGLPRDLSDCRGQAMILDLPPHFPGGEVPGLPGPGPRTPHVSPGTCAACRLLCGDAAHSV